MRDRKEILKDYVDIPLVAVFGKFKQAQIKNPKIQLEVMLDIRDLLIELKNKAK